jgi:hypothetical protein
MKEAIKDHFPLFDIAHHWRHGKPQERDLLITRSTER